MVAIVAGGLPRWRAVQCRTSQLVPARAVSPAAAAQVAPSLGVATVLPSGEVVYNGRMASTHNVQILFQCSAGTAAVGVFSGAAASSDGVRAGGRGRPCFRPPRLVPGAWRRGGSRSLPLPSTLSAPFAPFLQSEAAFYASKYVRSKDSLATVLPQLAKWMADAGLTLPVDGAAGGLTAGTGVDATGGAGSAQFRSMPL